MNEGPIGQIVNGELTVSGMPGNEARTTRFITRVGLPAIVRENPGWNCGYVRLPPSLRKTDGSYDDYSYEVHGGLTYSGDLDSDGQLWLGFDCAHSGDLKRWPTIAPSGLPLVPMVWEMAEPVAGETFKDVPFVMVECENLAAQMVAGAKGMDVQ